jgi:hypothetical protein
MANKKITDLTLRSNFDATCNIPVDDSSQTWRTTGAQVLAFVRSAARSMISANSSPGNGSTNTFVARFTNQSTFGSDVTFADDASLGSSFTINTDGLYFVGLTAQTVTGGASIGVTVNHIGIIPDSLSLTAGSIVTSSCQVAVAGSASTLIPLSTGDVIRVNTDGNTLSNNAQTDFRIIGPL